MATDGGSRLAFSLLPIPNPVARSPRGKPESRRSRAAAWRGSPLPRSSSASEGLPSAPVGLAWAAAELLSRSSFLRKGLPARLRQGLPRGGSASVRRSVGGAFKAKWPRPAAEESPSSPRAPPALAPAGLREGGGRGARRLPGLLLDGAGPCAGCLLRSSLGSPGGGSSSSRSAGSREGKAVPPPSPPRRSAAAAPGTSHPKGGGPSPAHGGGGGFSAGASLSSLRAGSSLEIRDGAGGGRSRTQHSQAAAARSWAAEKRRDCGPGPGLHVGGVAQAPDCVSRRGL